MEQLVQWSAFVIALVTWTLAIYLTFVLEPRKRENATAVEYIEWSRKWSPVAVGLTAAAGISTFTFIVTVAAP